MTEISLRGKDTCESVTPAVFKGNSFAFRKEKYFRRTYAPYRHY